MSTFTIITLTGQFAGATGGLLYAQLSSTMTNAALGTIQAGTTYQAGIGADGTVSLPLPANDDPGSTPGTAWRVTGMLAPSGRYTATVQLLRAGGGVQNLATLDPAAGTTPYLSYIPLPQRGTANGVAPLDSAGLVPTANLPLSGTGVPLSSATPLADSGSGATGTVLASAHGDHSHPLAATYATSGAVATEATTARAAEGANATAISAEATARAGGDATNATALTTHTSATGNVHGLDDTTLLVQDPTAGGIVHSLRVTLAALMTAIATKIGNPLTALGDLFVGGAAGVPSRLPVGTLGQTLTVGSGGPTWAAAGGGGAVVPQVGGGVGVAAIGDSTTEDVGTRGSFLTYLMLNDPRTRWVVNAGIGGQRSAQMLARIATDVVAFAPDFCTVLCGVNDYSGLVPVATTISNVKAMYAALLAAGITPICCCVPAVGVPFLDTLNTWILRYARAHRLPLVDFRSVLMKPDGTWISGYTADNTHPTHAGCVAMAAGISAVLDPWLTPNGKVPLAEYNADTSNLLTNALYQTSSSGIPTGWSTFYGDRTGKTYSVVSDPTDSTGYRNLWQIVSLSSPQNAAYGFDVASAAGNDGDILEFSGRIKATMTGAGEFNWRLTLQLGGTVWKAFPAYTANLDGVFSVRFTLPAGATGHARAYLYLFTEDGTWQIGQWALRNLTALGTV